MRTKQRMAAMRLGVLMLAGACGSARAQTLTNFQDANVVVGQASFTARSTAVNQATTPTPVDVAISATGKMAVAEQGTNRVLIYNTIPTANGAPADVVVGQPDFTTSSGGTTQLKTSFCNGVAFSADGSKMLVSDSGNNRVLIWNTVPTSNGQPADVVIGQADFTTSASGISAANLNRPADLIVTPGGKLLIMDNANNRVLIYNSIPTVNGAAADVVIGQPSFTANTAGNGAASLNSPFGLGLSPDGRLLMDDGNNNRVLVFNAIPTTNGASADVVIGQSGFGMSGAGTSATQLSVPSTPSVSSAGRLAIAEYGNNRVLIYNQIPTVNGAAADVVLGQPNFTTNTASNGGVTARSMAEPYVALFAQDRLLVAGRSMSRVMIFNAPVPVARDDAFTLAEDAAPTVLDVLANDSNASGTPAITNVSGGTLGTATITNGGTRITYTPRANANGSDSFTYTIQDAGGTTQTATVSITLTPVNDPPQNSVPGPQSTDEDTALTLDDPTSWSSSGISVDDPDTDTLTVTLSVAHGTLTLSQTTGLTFTAGDGTADATMTFSGDKSDINAALRMLRYDPDANFSGSDTLSLSTNDGIAPAVVSTVAITVNAVNDAPVIGALSGTTVYILGRPAILIDSDATITDVDSANFDGGELRVRQASGATGDIIGIRSMGTGAGQVSTAGSTVFYEGTAIGTFSGGSNGPPFVVALNGAATPAAVQALVRSITFSTTSSFTLDRPIQFTVSDGDGGTSAIANKTVTISNNQPPVVTLPGASVSYTEGSGPLLVDAGATAMDADSTDLDGGTLTIDFAANAQDDDRLDFADQGQGAGQVGVTGSTVSFAGTVIGTRSGGADSVPLVVTFNASATPTAVQALLRRLTFASVSDAPPTAARTLRVVLSDGDGGTSDAATKSVSIAAVNDAPSFTIADNTVTANEDAGPQVRAGFATQISAGPGGEGGQNVAFNITGNSRASLFAVAPSISNDGELRFTSAPDAFGTATITVTLSDDGGTANGGADTSAPQTFTITIGAQNDAPVLSGIESGALVYTENNPATPISASITVSDVDSATLSGATVAISSGYDSLSDRLEFTAQNGITGAFEVGSGVLRLSGRAGVAEYQAALRGVRFLNVSENASGPRVVSFSVSDGGAGSNTMSRVVTVQGVNDAPVAQPSSVGTDEDTPLQITLAASDPDGSAFTYEIVSGPGHGTLSGSGAVRTYTPARDFTGSDSFTYRVNDGALNSNTEVIAIVVGGENDAPVAANDAAATDEDTPINVQVLGNDLDADAGTVLTVARVAVTAATHGTVSIAADKKSVRLVPEANFNGVSSFSYTVSDGSLESAATVTITVRPVNDAPVAASQSVSTAFGAAVSVMLRASDVDSDTLTFAIVSGPSHGTLSGSGAAITYTPGAGFSGADAFTFRVHDGALSSNGATVAVQVVADTAPIPTPTPIPGPTPVPAPGNRAPVAAADSYSTRGPLQLLAGSGVLANDTDADGNRLSTILLGTPRHGTLVLRADGGFTYTPSTSFSGVDSFRYRASDGQALSGAGVVSIAVTALPDGTPPQVVLAGGLVRRLRSLEAARGSAADVYVLRGRDLPPSSGLKSIVLRLQRADGQFWNGRAYQKAPFDLTVRLLGRSFFALAATLPTAAQTPEGRYRWTAVATDNRGNRAYAQQTILIDRTPPNLSILSPAAGSDGVARIARLDAVSGRAADTARVDLWLRRGDGRFWNGRSYQAAPTFLSVAVRGGAYLFPASSLPSGANLAPGSYTLQARAQDDAGNIAVETRALAVASAPTG